MSARSRLTAALVVMGLAVTACACAAQKSGPPSSAPSAQGYARAADPSGGTASSENAPYAQPPPPPPLPPPQAQTQSRSDVLPSADAAKPAQPSAPSGAPPAGASSRSAAMQSASRDVEASQRELDIAGSDCRNACRALMSMDRAAGRLCELSRSDGEPRRCDDAKQRVYSARERVKSTCGTCADGTTVERAAPIPSR